MRPQGFTLIEVLIVLAVVGIIAALGISSLLGSIRNTQADQAVSSLVGVFSQAKNRVRTTNRNVQVAWNTTTKTLTLSQSGVVLSATTLETSTLTSSCRATCTGNTIELLAPHGTLPQDIKFSVSVVDRSRTAYLLGPTAMLKVTNP